MISEKEVLDRGTPSFIPLASLTLIHRNYDIALAKEPGGRRLEILRPRSRREANESEWVRRDEGR